MRAASIWTTSAFDVFRAAGSARLARFAGPLVMGLFFFGCGDDSADATLAAADVAEDGGASGPGNSSGMDASAARGDAAEDGSSAQPLPEHEFVAVDGLAVVEFEEFHQQTFGDGGRGPDWHQWFVFDADNAPSLSCTTNVACDVADPPDCNEHPDCDDDDWSLTDVSGGYVEALPNRRRTDHENNTGFCVRNVNRSGALDTPTLTYRVNFTTAGRYYVWVRCQAKGPADNGIHVGLDGMWPVNELVDESNMRLQLPGGVQWSQDRRGGSQHTGVSATDEVSRRDANVWLEIDTPGVHTVQFGMREDGVACDKFVLATDPDYEPEGLGPSATRATR
ncbi:MAG: hypothetical protein AAF355_09075 [Myxococcota bacterium]